MKFVRLYWNDRDDHNNFANDPWTKCLEIGSLSAQKSDFPVNQHEKFYSDIQHLSEHSELSDLVKLTHVDAKGQAQMVDVSDKTSTLRRAKARAIVSIGEVAFKLVQNNQIQKGDVLKVAEIAGIMGSKLTWQLIPLCHPIALSQVSVNLTLDEANHSVIIESVATTRGPTGVEMEALTAVSIAALTVYDMIKAVTKEAEIHCVQLVSKSAGSRSDYYR